MALELYCDFIRLTEDLQDFSENTLIDPLGESTLPLLNLLITGKARPYLHNGIMAVTGADVDIDVS